jgi:long-subunit acyl-CoA synthetase (AMP-forming)
LDWVGKGLRRAEARHRPAVFRYIFPTPMATFYDRFCECAERWPGSIALEIQRHDQVESYTYAEVRKRAEAIAGWIVENKFEPGARCAIFADNHPRWVMAYLGVIAAGCTTVPLDTALHTDQVTKLLKDSGALLIFSDQKHLRVVQEAADGLAIKILLTDESEDKGARATFAGSGSGSGNFSPTETSTDSLASLLYTSGTTADPKGVMLTHANLLAEVEAVFKRIQVAVSCAFADGQSSAPTGTRRARGVPGNLEHDRVAAGASRTEDYGVRGGATVFQFNSRAHFQRSG